MRRFPFSPLDLLRSVYTRAEMNEAAMWLLLCGGGILLQAGLVHAVILGRLAPVSIALAGLSAPFIVLALVPVYWARFAGVVVLSALLAWDLAARLNPFGAVFLAAAVYHVWKMAQYHSMHEGKAVLK